MGKAFAKLSALALGAACCFSQAQADGYNIGVYYYPGWHPRLPAAVDPYGTSAVNHTDQTWCGSGAPTTNLPLGSFRGGTAGDAWCTIKTNPATNGRAHVNFPERQPAQGYYDDSSSTVMKTQLDQMAAAGVKFVVFNYYWKDAARGPSLDQSLKAYNTVATNGQLPPNFRHALLWNWESAALTPRESDLDTAVATVAAQFTKGSYLTRDVLEGGVIKRKAILFINSVGRLYDSVVTSSDYSAALPGTTKTQKTIALLNRIRAVAQTVYPDGVYLVGFTEPMQYWAGINNSVGFDAVSAYNYPAKINWSNPVQYVPPTNSDGSTDFNAYSDWYAQTWTNFRSYTSSTHPYFLPISTGFDFRPWIAPYQDGSVFRVDGTGTDYAWKPTNPSRPSSGEQFAAHLRRARAELDSYPARTADKTAIICCWNEYGEGSILEPTKQYANGDLGSPAAYLGSSLLDAVKKVFVDGQ